MKPVVCPGLKDQMVFTTKETNWRCSLFYANKKEKLNESLHLLYVTLLIQSSKQSLQKVLIHQRLQPHAFSNAAFCSRRPVVFLGSDLWR